jgi:hypothetical protein
MSNQYWFSYLLKFIFYYEVNKQNYLSECVLFNLLVVGEVGGEGKNYLLFLFTAEELNVICLQTYRMSSIWSRISIFPEVSPGGNPVAMRDDR